MTGESSFRCTECNHEWHGKPTWDRASPPRCSECRASGDAIEIIEEVIPSDNPDQEREADIVARLREGDSPLDIVESGIASLDEAKQILEDIEDLEDIVLMEESELEDRDSRMIERGKRAKEDEVESLKAEIKELRRQRNQLQSEVQQWRDLNKALMSQNYRSSRKAWLVPHKNQEIEELETTLKLEQDKRERAERKLEEYKDTVMEEIEEIRESHEETQKELHQKKKELREKKRRISELEDLLVDDLAKVAATARTICRPGVGPGVWLGYHQSVDCQDA